MQEYILNGEKMLTRDAAHAEIAAVLELPEWYGANLDALADILSGLHCTIRMQNTAEMLNSLRVYGCRLLEVLYDSPIEFIAETDPSVEATAEQS